MSADAPLGPPQNLGQMERFMETCLLFLLAEEPGHGYALAERLAEFGFEPESTNVGTLYRTLRRMEKDGLVQSNWEQSDQGPRRRVYTITDQGRRGLKDWMEILAANKRRVELLLERYQILQRKGPPAGE